MKIPTSWSDYKEPLLAQLKKWGKIGFLLFALKGIFWLCITYWFIKK
jgi:hypothetical protein